MGKNVWKVVHFKQEELHVLLLCSFGQTYMGHWKEKS